jgi:hypothetical protein
MRRFILGACALAGAAAVAGCADLVTGGPLIRDGEPTGYIEVINQTGHDMDVVLISDCSASTYGLNRLPEGAYIQPGYSWTFEVSAGCWDVDAGVVGVGEARQRLQVDVGYTTPYTVTN